MKTRILNILLMTAICLIVQAGAAFGGATLTVNSASFGQACDNQLSLEEALLLVRSDFTRALTTAEKDQITGATFVVSATPPPCGGVGWNATGGIGVVFADEIFFTDAVGVMSGPALLGKNDDINGLKPNGQKVILDGTGCSGCSGISFDRHSTGSQIKNLIIRNFAEYGIIANTPDGANFEGLEIYGNGLHGILIQPTVEGGNARNINIGGTDFTQRNKIYSNGGNGILISAFGPPFNPTQNIVIQNNFIGTSNGTTDNGNSLNGIKLVDTSGVTIGDTTGLTRNIISGNNNDGIQLSGTYCVSTKIVWNFIGTTTSGSGRLGNSWSGVGVVAGTGDAVDFINSLPNQIGMAGLGNVISANDYGVVISDATTSNNRVQGNYIGTNTGGNTDVGNNTDGILIRFGASDNLIGGTSTGEGNLIAFNRNGIYAESGVRNSFRRNRVFSNDNLGIDLVPVGVTTNDTGDPDTGPNDLQNFPVITYLNAQSGSLNVQGTFNSTANQNFTLEFFGNSAADSTGYGEGRNFLGSVDVTTNAGGNATFNANFSATLTNVGQYVTVMATNSTGSSSEYSLARNICADLSLSPTSVMALAGGGTGNFTVTTSSGCTYDPQSNASWITVTGSSSGSVNYSIAPNAGVQRNGAINVFFTYGGFSTFATFNIFQSNGCTYSINPTSRNLAAGSGNSTVNVVASDSSCPWTATSNASWITITSGSSGTGSASVGFSVTANTGPVRTGTITAAGQTFTVSQASGCTFSLSHPSASYPASGTSNDGLTLTAGSGCTWTAVSNATWITITSGSSGSGNGSVSWSVAANTGPARQGTLTVAGQTFTINQASGCTFSLSSTSQNFPAGGGSNSVSVTAASGCAWTAVSNAAWITISSGTSGTGNGTVNYAVLANTGAARLGTMTIGGQTFTINQAAGTLRRTPFDFDGDGKTDIGIFRPSDGSWWYSRSSDNQFRVFSFGVSLDNLAPGDWTGDGKADISVYRPSTGYWFIQRSEDNSFFSFPFGANGDIPAPDDYDGDGKTDAAVFRPSNATWYILNSGGGGTSIVQFGSSEDKPVNADFDGDGKADIAVFRPSDGSWWYLRSSDGQFRVYRFGVSTDKPVRGDYTGDGKADIAVWRPSTGEWFVQRSEDNTYFSLPFGTNGDIPAPGDYDGDGKFDVAVFRPTGGTWYIQRTTAGMLIQSFGLAGDKPVPNAFVR